MAFDIKDKARRCCALERKRLDAELDSCDRNPKVAAAHHDCIQKAARRSGRRARKCITVG
jgi:hypothetical protein